MCWSWNEAMEKLKTNLPLPLVPGGAPRSDSTKTGSIWCMLHRENKEVDRMRLEVLAKRIAGRPLILRILRGFERHHHSIMSTMGPFISRPLHLTLLTPRRYRRGYSYPFQYFFDLNRLARKLYRVFRPVKDASGCASCPSQLWDRTCAVNFCPMLALTPITLSNLLSMVGWQLPTHNARA